MPKTSSTMRVVIENCANCSGQNPRCQDRWPLSLRDFVCQGSMMMGGHHSLVSTGKGPGGRLDVRPAW
jgi:hypothetical protein